MAGDLALASYHDLKGKMIMQVNMKKGNGKNSITSKQFNRGLIFQLIATGTCNTRIELSRRTGLAKTTVTNIVAEFMEKGIVKECEEELTEVCGRNPIILKVADQAPKIIGILVFRTNIQAVLCSLDMQIFRTETIEFGELTGDILIQNAFELIDRMMEEEKNILGIGIASIGPVDIRNGIILNPPRFYGVKHVPIKEAIQKKYNLPVYFDHDNNCAALAEKLFGIGKAEQDFLLLAVSNGIGSGFVCGGEVFHSHRGFETELGHVSINCKGLQCSCGNRGCLEMYASSYVVREKLKKITGLNLSYADYFKIHDRPEVEDILEEMIQDISAEMKRTGLPLEAVIVELTESDLLEQNINEKHFLTELKRMGISLALDDFGTGYSNFHYLSELKPEIIKIDRSFTAKAVADEQEYYLLNQFCTMIHNLDMKICIEGIESAQEWLKIRKLCPEFTQGYFWGKPCGYEEFVRKFVQEK